MSKDDYEKPTAEQRAVAEKALDQVYDELQYTTKEYTIEVLLPKLERGDLFVPHYQRKFTWPDDFKCRFIESLLMGLPIPYLFFCETHEAKLEIIDGWQRMSAIRAFVKNEFFLIGLERLSALDGFRFEDLPDSHRRRFHDRSLRAIVLAKTADRDKQDLFGRINTGSWQLEPIEVRRGALPGPFSSFLESLADDPVFNAICPMTQRSKDLRQREEAVGRFFAYGDGLDDYDERPRNFLFDYTKKMNEQFAANPGLESQFRERFHRVMNFVQEHFPFGFRKTKDGQATPKVRFEAISVGTWWAMKEDPSLTAPRKPISAWIDGEDFIVHTTSSAANTRRRVRERIEFVRDQLLGRI